MANQPKVGNVIVAKDTHTMCLQAEYIITDVPSFNEGEDIRLVTARLTPGQETIPGGFYTEIKLPLNRDNEHQSPVLRDCYEIKDHGPLSEVEVLVDELFFRESSKESIESYLGEIGHMSDGGYLIKTGKYTIKTSLDRLLQMSMDHEVSVDICNGKIKIS